MTRRSPRRRSGWDADATRPAGVRANFDGQCPRCDRPITRHGNQVVQRKGEWIHVECASGASDE